MGDGGDRGNIEHFEPGIADGLADHEPGVFGRIAARKPSRSRGLTKVVVMPKRGSVWARRLMVPP